MELRVLCVHGMGSHPMGGSWEGRWKASIEQALRRIDGEVVPRVEFVHLDDLFAAHDIGYFDVLEAIAKLAGSAAASLLRTPRSVGDQLRWTAGMVVQWVADEALRCQTREALAREVNRFEPDVIVGHSLGSLVCYDAFTHDEDGAELVRRRRFVSCGSQIGNPFVVGSFGGRLSALPAAGFWYHLFNAEDDVFTAPIRLSDVNFAQIDTFFDIQGIADHDVTEYMRHRRTVDTVWSDAVMALHRNAIPRVLPATAMPAAGPASQRHARPGARALLVGINEYADPSMNLEGCVNDVFLTSSVLQESGFGAEDIRVLLDARATRQGIAERIDWLLDGARDGDVRLLYYSGHGAQLPLYGAGGRIDRVAETLVPHDFDWSPATAYTDSEFQSVYSQLPYGVRFVALFDCCYAAGMTRACGPRVRGIDPPDDIRHRLLRWDAEHEMWVERRIEPVNPTADAKFNGVPPERGPVRAQRLGQAMALRTLPHPRMKQVARARGHAGPYLPVLMYSCGETELSYEYRHGVQAYGAFTYCLARALRRDHRLKRPKLSFDALVAAVGKELSTLGYAQHPTLAAPSEVRTGRVLPLARPS